MRSLRERDKPYSDRARVSSTSFVRESSKEIIEDERKAATAARPINFLFRSNPDQNSAEMILARPMLFSASSRKNKSFRYIGHVHISAVDVLEKSSSYSPSYVCHKYSSFLSFDLCTETTLPASPKGLSLRTPVYAYT